MNNLQLLPSPQIIQVKWGKMSIEGIGDGKDFKLWPGGGRAWDWNETNTHHVPGIQTLDVEEILDHRATEIILSRGMLLALHTCEETIKFLKKMNIKFQTLETRKAVTEYNRLAGSGIAAGGLFHSTC